jgi:hypothetical protein
MKSLFHRSHGSINNDDDEVIRLVEEISFQDEYSLSWDPTHLEDTFDRVKMYENIVNEHLISLDGRLDDYATPISDSQIRDIFFSSLDSEENSSKLISNIDASSKLVGPASPTNSEKKSFSKDQKLKETVDSIRRSLRWYQNKIVQQIESTNEVSVLIFHYLLSLSSLFRCTFVGC